MKTEPTNAPVTPELRKLLTDILTLANKQYGCDFEGAAQLLANFERDAVERAVADCATLNNPADEVANLRAERDALAAQVAVLREALERQLPSTSEAAIIRRTALATTPESASAELAALREEKARLDWLMNWNAIGHPFKDRTALDAARRAAL